MTSQEKSNTLWNNDKAYIRNIPRLRHEAHAFCLTIFLKPGMKKSQRCKSIGTLTRRQFYHLLDFFLQDVRIIIGNCKFPNFFVSLFVSLWWKQVCIWKAHRWLTSRENFIWMTKCLNKQRELNCRNNRISAYLFTEMKLM